MTTSEQALQVAQRIDEAATQLDVRIGHLVELGLKGEQAVGIAAGEIAAASALCILDHDLGHDAMAGTAAAASSFASELRKAVVERQGQLGLEAFDRALLSHLRSMPDFVEQPWPTLDD